MEVDLPGCSVTPDRDWLFDRMASPGEGWHIRSEHGDVRPILSDLDLAVLETIRRSAQRHARLAVSVPRVVVGLVLAPVIYAALRTLIEAERPVEAGTVAPFPIRPGECILVASRSHAMRDLLAESVLSFNRVPTRLVEFPTYRLTRDGTLAPGAFGRLPKALRPRPEQMLVTVPPIVVYDYWPLPPEVRLPYVAAVFAELAEHDGVDAVERLREVVERTGAGFVVTIVNINDVGKRERLTALGFEFMAARTPVEGRANELCPTFTGVDLAAPKMHRVTFHCLSDDAPVVAALTEAFQLLAEVHARLSPDDVYPLPLGRAWYVLDQLAGCPSSLERYERLRRQDAYRQSLRFRIEGLERVNWGLVPESVRGSLMVRWPHIIERLRRVYDLVLQDNPKWWALAEMVLYVDAPMAVIVSNRLAAQALREDLLIEFDWSEDASSVQIRSLAEARRNDERFDRVVVLGQWSDRQRALLFSLMPREVWVLGYPFEGPVLEKRLQALQTDLDTTVASATRATLTRLLGTRARPVDTRYDSTTRWDAEVLAAARRMARRHWASPQHKEDHPEDDLLFERIASRTPAAPPPMEDAADEALETVTLTFADSLRLVVPADRELLVLPAAGGATEQRFPADVSPGDRVLLLSSDEQTDLFSTALSRTSHLIPSDARVLGRWREALVTIRRQYPPTVYGAGARFVDALGRLGCTRDGVTIRSWLRGSTMAPRERDDVALVLRLAGGFTDIDTWATLIDREMNIVRDFHRRIGRRIARRLLGRGEVDGRADRIDQEIDELLEQTELRTVSSVGAVEPRPKHAVIAGSCEEREE